MKIHATLFSFILTLCFQQSTGQNKYQHSGNDELKIKSTIIQFLTLYKIQQTYNPTDTPTYFILKGGYPDTTTKQIIDMKEVERYLFHLKDTGYLSDSFINDLRAFYKMIADNLEKTPKTQGLTKIPYLDDGDEILHSDEPEEILDHFKNGKFKRIEIIDNKAIASFNISTYVQLIFTLTKVDNKWLIDYIGYDGDYFNRITTEPQPRHHLHKAN